MAKNSEKTVVEWLTKVYLKHGHKDDWGVSVIYLAPLSVHLTRWLRKQCAKAWEEGHQAGLDEAILLGPDETPNPYKKAK